MGCRLDVEARTKARDEVEGRRGIASRVRVTLRPRDRVAILQARSAWDHFEFTVSTNDLPARVHLMLGLDVSHDRGSNRPSQQICGVW